MPMFAWPTPDGAPTSASTWPINGAIPGSAPPAVVGGHRTGDVRHVFASPARAERTFGFRASVSFTDGMRAFAHDPLRG